MRVLTSIICLFVLQLGLSTAASADEVWNFSADSSSSSWWESGEPDSVLECAKTELRVKLSQGMLTIEGDRDCANGVGEIYKRSYVLKGDEVHAGGKKVGTVDRVEKSFHISIEYYDTENDRHYKVESLFRTALGHYRYDYVEGIQAEESYQLTINDMDLQ